MTKLVSSDTINNVFSMQVIPDKLFKEPSYIVYNNKLRECILKKVIDRLGKDVQHEYIVDIAGVGEVKLNNIYLYSDIENYKKGNVEFFTKYPGGAEYCVSDFINTFICECCSTGGWEKIYTYKWDGLFLKVERVPFMIPNAIIQDQYGIDFDDLEEKYDLSGCYCDVNTCKKYNDVDVVKFEKIEKPTETPKADLYLNEFSLEAELIENAVLKQVKQEEISRKTWKTEHFISLDEMIKWLNEKDFNALDFKLAELTRTSGWMVFYKD